MNDPDARAVWTLRGYRGEFRLAWKADYYVVQKWDDAKRQMVPEYFTNEHAAECAAWREKNRIEQPVMVRDGAKIETSSAGDALFPSLKPIFRKGKRVEVARKGEAA